MHPQIHVESGRRDSIDNTERAVGLHGDVHEPIDIRDDVTLAAPVSGVGKQEILHARVLRLGVIAVTQGIALAATGSADGVVVGNGRRHDLGHRPALARHQYTAGSQEDISLGSNRVLGAVALTVVVRRIEQEVDCLIAVQVEDAQRLARAHQVIPGGASRDDLIEQYAARQSSEVRVAHGVAGSLCDVEENGASCVLHQRWKYSSTLRKARSASGLALRIGSSGGVIGPRHADTRTGVAL